LIATLSTGDTRDFSAQQLPYFRGKPASLSELVRDKLQRIQIDDLLV